MATAQPLTFGHLLRRSRLAAGLTQEELAARAGVGVRSISDLERGVRRTPYRDTVALLAEALHLTEPERRQFEAAARGQGTARPHQSPTSRAEAAAQAALLPALVGRARELAAIERLLAGEGPPVPVLLVAGEPGIGKTRLLREAAGRAPGRGWSVLVGGCSRRGAQEPYAPLLPALAGHLRGQSMARLRLLLEGCAWLVRLLPELAETTLVPVPQWSLPPEQERRLMFAAVGRFLANVAGPAGTLLLLDDLQWAGADAFDLLATAVRSAAAPLRVVGAYRSTEVPPLHPLAATLADLARDGLAARIELGPLVPLEAQTLLERLLEGGTGERAALVERVLARAGGVPFFLVSCAQALRAGALDEGAGAGGEAEAVPWDVAQTIRQRVAALSQPAQELLAAAAVAGRVVPGALLVAVMSRSEDEVLAALEAACQAGLLVEEEGEDVYQFAHDLIREVVAAGLGTRRRKGLHRRVAEALEQMPGEPAVDRLAYHFARSGDQEKAILYLEQAGDRARALYAHVEAETYYRQLIERLEALGRNLEAARAREQLGEALVLRAAYAAALEVYDRALEVYRAAGDEERVARVMAEVARVHASRGTTEQGLARVTPYLESAAAQQLGPEALARLYSGLARLLRTSNQYERQRVAAERALHCARLAQHPALTGQAEVLTANALIMLDRAREASPLLEDATALLQATGQLSDLARAVDYVAYLHGLEGQFGVALEDMRRARSLADDLGDPTWQAYVLGHSGDYEFLTGNWTAARADYEQGLHVIRSVEASSLALWPLRGLAFLAGAEGKADEAGRYLQEIVAHAKHNHDIQSLRDAYQLQAEEHLLCGRATEALALLLPVCDGLDPREADATELLPQLAWAYLETGDADGAASILERASERAKAAQHRSRLPDVLRIRGLVASRQGDWSAAEGALDEALTLARAMLYPYAEAKALYVYGQMHATKGEPTQARERFEAALAILNRLGERLYATYVEQVMGELAQAAPETTAPRARSRTSRQP